MVALRNAIAFLTVLGAFVLTPAIAAACPYCAGRAEKGPAELIITAVFVLFPFAVVGASYRLIKYTAGAEAVGAIPTEDPEELV